MAYLIVILFIISAFFFIRFDKRDNFRIGLKPGDVGKMFLIANETDDGRFYVVITKRLSFTEVEVEYNVSYEEPKHDYAKNGYILSKTYRIKDIIPIRDKEHNYFCDGFKKRIEELKSDGFKKRTKTN